MGWSYRKSLGAGPFRLNLSRRGIGYSIGGRGFRLGIRANGRRYTSLSVPGTGLRYTKTGCLPVAVVLISGPGLFLIMCLLWFRR